MFDFEENYLSQIILRVYEVIANGPGDRGSILGQVIPKTQKW